jgi:alpha-L-fucosidase
MLSRREFLGVVSAIPAITGRAGRFSALEGDGLGLTPGKAREFRQGDGLGLTPGKARPLPSNDQLSWQRDERALFLHFGMNTFTDREWGEGTEDPALFNPTALDARQWARVARAAGCRALILTAKHHDGFCLWPTRTTRHSVAASPWRAGHGDVVREFVDACRAEGLRAGLYLSPWDRHEPTYGDSPRYNDFYAEQLTELLTRYGRIDEVWFDGANGEGPNGRKQTYDWPRVWALVRTLQPHAIRFSDAGPDVRWIGNEQGVAGDPNWSMVDPAVVPVPGLSGRAVTAMLLHGDPNGTVWRPGETDVSIRPGWFHHDAETARVRSVDNLVGLYFTSVGRNSKLLLNVPPTRAGLIDDVDAARLAGMHDRLATLFAEDVAHGARALWRNGDAATSVAEIDLGTTRRVGLADLREDIQHGQWVSSYAIEGTGDDKQWQPLAHGTTVGYRRLERWPAASVRRIRVTVSGAPEAARDVRVALFAGDAS